MRRALPWLTVGLLVVGLGVGTGLGIAGQTSTPLALTATAQISRIVAATRSARTARFTYSDSTASPNPLLRQADRGSGAVDFGADTMQTVERDRSTGYSGTSATTTKVVTQDVETDNVWIGRTRFIRFRPETNLALDLPWMKEAAWPKGSFGPLGALGQIGPLGELEGDESIPGLRVEDAGAAVVHGAETTRYRLVVPLCGTSAPRDGIAQSIAPLQLWVDGRGRLVQARLSSTEDITTQAHLGDVIPGQGFLTGRATTVSTIDLNDFGAPTTIVAPQVRNTNGGGESGFATMELKGHCD